MCVYHGDMLTFGIQTDSDPVPIINNSKLKLLSGACNALDTCAVMSITSCDFAKDRQFAIDTFSVLVSPCERIELPIAACNTCHYDSI